MTNELEERNKKRKARRNKRRLMSLLGIILVLIYIPALWNWVFSVNYEIGVIKTATLEIKVPVRGLLVRKEFVINSPGDGIIIPGTQYGERVANGSELAAFIQTDMREVVDNYRQLEIDILKRVVEGFDNTTGSERELWEAAIEDQIGKLTDLSNTGDLSNADAIRAAIDRVLENRARYILENDSMSKSLKNEKNELERLRNSMAKSVKSIYSSASGVISYFCDGSETSLTPDNRFDISFEQIEEAIKSRKENDKWLTPAEISVSNEQPFCKLVINDEGWITFSIPEKQGKEIAVLFETKKLEKQQVTLDMEIDGTTSRMPVVLEQIGENKDGLVKMTARMTRLIEQTMDMRGVTGSLVLQSVTGMKVPLRSLFNENTTDDTADIAIVDMNKVRFNRVKITGRQDSYAIIENVDTADTEKSVNTFDIYLVNPKNVVEGQVVEK